MKEKRLEDIPLSEIMPNRFQPRIHFDEDKIESLARSIIKYGVLEPIIVRPLNGKFEIIAGERRFKASQLAGKATIPAIIVEYNDKESIELALLENIQRQELTAIEEAIAYRRILDMGYITQEELAKKTGKSQPTIANKMRLLSLDDETQEALINHKISERHARSLLRLTGTGKEIEMLNRIIRDRLTVRQTDDAIAEILSNKSPVITEIKEEKITKQTPKIVDNFKSNSDFHKIESLFDENNIKEEKGETKNMDIEKIIQEAEDINANQEPKDMSGFINVPSPYETIMDATPAPANDISDIMNAPAQEEHNKFINVLPVEEPKEEKKEEVQPTVTFDSVFHSTFNTPSPTSTVTPDVTPEKQNIVEPVTPVVPQVSEFEEPQVTPVTPVVNEEPKVEINTFSNNINSVPEDSNFESTSNPLNFSSPLEQIKAEALSVPPISETPAVTPVPETITPVTESVPSAPEIEELQVTSVTPVVPEMETPVVPEVSSVPDFSVPSQNLDSEETIPSIEVTTPENNSGSEIPEFTSTIAESAPTSPLPVETSVSSPAPVSEVEKLQATPVPPAVPEMETPVVPEVQSAPEITQIPSPIMDGIQRNLNTSMPTTENTIPSTQEQPLNDVSSTIPTEPVVYSMDIPDPSKPVETKENDLTKVLDIIKNCSKQIEEAGYTVRVNELDLITTYQVTFSIDKK